MLSYPILNSIFDFKPRLINLLACIYAHTVYCYVHIFKFFLLLFLFGINFTVLLYFEV